MYIFSRFSRRNHKWGCSYFIFFHYWRRGMISSRRSWRNDLMGLWFVLNILLIFEAAICIILHVYLLLSVDRSYQLWCLYFNVWWAYYTVVFGGLVLHAIYTLPCVTVWSVVEARGVLCLFLGFQHHLYLALLLNHLNIKTLLNQIFIEFCLCNYNIMVVYLVHCALGVLHLFARLNRGKILKILVPLRWFCSLDVFVIIILRGLFAFPKILLDNAIDLNIRLFYPQILLIEYCILLVFNSFRRRSFCRFLRLDWRIISNLDVNMLL